MHPIFGNKGLLFLDLTPFLAVFDAFWKGSGLMAGAYILYI